jgi:hypothetical protein
MSEGNKSRPPWDWTVDDIPQAISFLSEPPLPDGVGIVVPPHPRSLHVCIAQALRETEGLLARLTRGVSCADSHRPVVRELYVTSLKLQKLLTAALRLELE